MKSVVRYFQETYGFAIQHLSLPCLQVGNQQRPNYLPMEVSYCYYNMLFVLYDAFHLYIYIYSFDLYFKFSVVLIKF